MDGNRFAFKPVFKLKDGKSLIKLLKHYDLKGLGGIMLEDIQESLPHCEKVLKHVEKKIVYIIRPTDKKKILFYNDTTANITVIIVYRKLMDFSKKRSLNNEHVSRFRWTKNSKSYGDQFQSMQWTMPKLKNISKNKV